MRAGSRLFFGSIAGLALCLLAGCQGASVEVASCGPATCAGCCRDGVCVAGTSAAACGAAGEACSPCRSGEACEDGECAPEDGSRACGPMTCTGCCSAGLCRPGTSDSACGVGGLSCQACTTGLRCSGGRCGAPACDPSTCPSGCCSDGRCYTEQSDSYCGSGGVQCNACSMAGTRCGQDGRGSFRCVAAPDAGAPDSTQGGTFAVTLVGAAIAEHKPNGEAWDGTSESGCLAFLGCASPDVYAAEGSRVAGLTVPRVVETNTTSPRWNLSLGTADERALVGAAITLTLKDEDTAVLGDDSIGSCSTTVTAQHVADGRVTLTGTSGCSGAIQSVEIGLARVD